MTVAAPSPRERAGSAALTALIVGALGYALVVGLGVAATPPALEASLATFAVLPDRPLPEPKPIPPPRKVARPAGRAAPPNLRSKATEVTAPTPVIVTLPPPIVVAVPPGIGAQATSGASDRAGPGTGAGGQGNGTAAGGDGDGDGSGYERVPRLLSGRFKGSDLPDAITDTGFRGTVAVRYRVGTDGRVTGCLVTRSSGSALMDAVTCRGIEKRFRYDPWRDADGRPVRSIVTREQEWDIDPPGMDQRP